MEEIKRNWKLYSEDEKRVFNTFRLKTNIFVDVKTLKNQPLSFYQGIQARTMQLEYYDISWNVGLKYDF